MGGGEGNEAARKADNNVRSYETTDPLSIE
jgi:hypothetical protein